MPVLYHLSLPALTPVRPQLGKLKIEIKQF